VGLPEGVIPCFTPEEGLPRGVILPVLHPEESLSTGDSSLFYTQKRASHEGFSPVLYPEEGLPRGVSSLFIPRRRASHHPGMPPTHHRGYPHPGIYAPSMVPVYSPSLLAPTLRFVRSGFTLLIVTSTVPAFPVQKGTSFTSEINPDPRGNLPIWPRNPPQKAGVHKDCRNLLTPPRVT